LSDDPRALAPGQPRGEAVAIDFEGRTVRAFAGEPVGVALFAAGVRTLGRSPKYHRPRGLFCLEGHCASCFLRIDGRPNRRSCLVPAREGLRCERQNAFPDADVDLLRAADWLFPGGMDHHRMMTGSRVGNELFLKLVREMGGSGLLPDAPPEEVPPVRDEAADLCVVGAGPAGLSAARAAAGPGRRVVVIDEQDLPGGSLLAEPDGVARGRELAEAAQVCGAELWTGATAIAYYPEDAPGGVLAVVRPGGLVRLTARRYLYATGGYDQNLPFPGNDRPGILSARACGRLVFRWGIHPGRRVVVISDARAPAPFATTLASGLERLGIELLPAALDALPRLDLKRDLAAVAAVPAPASELPRQHGARVELDPARGGFAVVVDGAFATSVSGVHAVGDVTGYVGPRVAAERGGAAGQAIARSLQ
jgi:sarcosine oxidase subunit alpha